MRFIKEYVVSSLHTECFKNLSKDNTINMNECDIMFAKDLSARKMIVHNLSLGLYSDIFRIFENRKQLCSTETPDNIIGECLKPISIYDEPILFIPSVFTDYDDSSVIYFRFPSGLFILFTNNRYGVKELFAEEMINSIIKNDDIIKDTLHGFGYFHGDDIDKAYDPDKADYFHHELIKCIVKEFIGKSEVPVTIEYKNYLYDIKFTLSNQKINITDWKDSICEVVNKNINKLFDSEEFVSDLCYKLYDLQKDE